MSSLDDVDRRAGLMILIPGKRNIYISLDV